MSQVKYELIKSIILQIETSCKTKDDVLYMLKEELYRLESDNTLYLLSEESTKEREFYLSLASQNEYWGKALSRETQMGIDIWAYKEKVEIWNDTVSSRDKKKKRTPKGWIATARQFMSSDKNKGCLILINKVKQNKAVDYLSL